MKRAVAVGERVGSLISSQFEIQRKSFKTRLEIGVRGSTETETNTKQLQVRELHCTNCTAERLVCVRLASHPVPISSVHLASLRACVRVCEFVYISKQPKPRGVSLSRTF